MDRRVVVAWLSASQLHPAPSPTGAARSDALSHDLCPRAGELGRVAIIYHVIARRQPYQELGEDYFQHYDPSVRAQRLVRQLAHLGFDVQILAQQSSAPMPDALTLLPSS